MSSQANKRARVNCGGRGTTPVGPNERADSSRRERAEVALRATVGHTTGHASRDAPRIRSLKGEVLAGCLQGNNSLWNVERKHSGRKIPQIRAARVSEDFGKVGASLARSPPNSGDVRICLNLEEPRGNSVERGQASAKSAGYTKRNCLNPAALRRMCQTRSRHLAARHGFDTESVRCQCCIDRCWMSWRS